MLDMFDLRLFDGEGGGAATAAAGAAEASGAGSVTDQAQGEAQDRQKAFDDFIKQHKDLYDARVKDQITRRMKASDAEKSTMRASLDRHNTLIAKLSEKYGVDATDLDGIEKAMDSDTSYIEEEAASRGLTVEQLRHMRAIEAENKRFKAAAEAQQAQMQRDSVLAKWNEQAEQLKAVYPDFDLETEAANADFAQLLGNGVDMRLAYEVIHRDELTEQSMRYAVQRTEKRVADSVRANGRRPAEGAGKGGAAAAIETDVSKMTKQQMEDLERRARRGERITL